MSKQTAVDWLIDQIVNHNGVNSKTFEQAKEMEREQMIKFALHLHNVDMSNTGIDILMDEAEQYYNETYKGGEQ